MSRYFIVCRLRWPALLLLTGVIALLDQMDILTWGRAWPLYLILLGVLALAERAALAAEPPPPPGFPYAPGYAQGYAPGYPPQAAGYQAPYQGPYQGTATGASSAQPAPPATTGIVPVHTDLEIGANDPGREPRKSWEEEGR